MRDSSWHDFDWHNVSRGLSAAAELVVSGYYGNHLWSRMFISADATVHEARPRSESAGWPRIHRRSLKSRCSTAHAGVARAGKTRTPAIQAGDTFIYTASQKKTRHRSLVRNFAKCLPIFSLLVKYGWCEN